MKFITKILFIMSLLLSSSAFAQAELVPFINFLRSTPAFISGTVYFNSDSVLFDDGWTQVKLLGNQPIDFTFKENYMEVRPRAGFYVKSYKLRVYVDSVTWTPAGMKSKSQVPIDITGLSQSYISGKVSEAISNTFGKKIVKANALLKRVRLQKTVGSTFEIAKAIVSIFTASTDTTSLNLPNYRGDIGLNFLPPANKAFNMYGIRVGIHGNDFYNTSFDFTGDRNGIYPYSVSMNSRDGMDFNYGKEYKIAARLIIKSGKINASGTKLDMHLGASQVLQGILTALERAAQVREPGASCPNCMELATFPSLRMKVEKQVRAAIVAQVEALWPLMQGLNIKPQIYSAFKRREACQQTGFTCAQTCNKQTNNTTDQKQCKQACDQKLRVCLK